MPVGLKDSYMGYGAVVPDGYGVSYNLQVGIIPALLGFFTVLNLQWALKKLLWYSSRDV